MATLETIQLTKKEAIYKWHKLDNLAVNGNIPDENGWYAVQRAHQKLYPVIKPMIERRSEVEKKMIVRDKAGRFTNDLKEEYSFEDFEQAIEAIESPEDMIDVEIYKIKLSTLKNATIQIKIPPALLTDLNATIMNAMRQQIKIPPALLTDLQEWIIDDYEESQAKAQEEKSPQPGTPLELPKKTVN